MSAFRFLHSSDLHLGRAFGGYPEGIRHRLREARHGVIGRLAQAARTGRAGFVLLAGDAFDAETPAPETLRQALEAADKAQTALNHARARAEAQAVIVEALPDGAPATLYCAPLPSGPG